MDIITLGLFHTQASAENAINELSSNGFSLENIYIVMKDHGIATQVTKSTGAKLEEALLTELIGLGLPKEEARIYEEDIKTGAILLGVPTSDNAVKQILHKHKASQVRSVTRTINSVKE